jgi:hypothetical protein
MEIIFRSKNTVLWNAFKVVSITDVFWDFIPCSFSSKRHFGECIISIFWVPYGDGISQLCYNGIAVSQPLHSRILFMVEEQSSGIHATGNSIGAVWQNSG